MVSSHSFSSLKLMREAGRPCIKCNLNDLSSSLFGNHGVNSTENSPHASCSLCQSGHKVRVVQQDSTVRNAKLRFLFTCQHLMRISIMMKTK